MSRSTVPSKFYLALVALVVVLAAGSAAFFLTQPKPIPVTSDVSPAGVEAKVNLPVDLEKNETQSENIAPALVDKPVLEKYGPGNALVQSIIGETNQVYTSPALELPALDMGAAYARSIIGETNQVYTSTALELPALDMGAAFVRSIIGETNQFYVPPAVKSSALDMGAAYAWSIIGEVGTQARLGDSEGSR